VLRFGSIGLFSAVLNIPLFVIAGQRIGKRFFLLSALGTVFSALFIDAFAAISMPRTEPLLDCLYGGVLCGLGLGTVFAAGGSTGGSDILVRLIKQKNPGMPIGLLTICLDMLVAIVCGIALRDISRTFYSGIVIFVSGRVVDAVIYRFDYSRVALIMSRDHQAVVNAIAAHLGRGATLLHGEGGYRHQPIKVVLTAVKRRQLSQLKQLIAQVDPDAFVIVQEAHQVLGDGFVRYSKDSL
jgi:uncharacterized membrane-anchored protein YitT (DUF2179 family)